MNKETTTAKPSPAPRTPMFIVAEISKNWPEESPGLISQKFEAIINHNLERGYRLVDWKHTKLTYTAQEDVSKFPQIFLSETIIAVFQLAYDRP